LQTRARKGAFGVRQLAAALQLGLMQIIANNWAIQKAQASLRTPRASPPTKSMQH